MVELLPLLQVKQAVVMALEAGYRHIDCAAIYGNEAEIGDALQDTVGQGKVKEQHILLEITLYFLVYC